MSSGEIGPKAFPIEELPQLIQSLEGFVLEYREMPQEQIDQWQVDTLLETTQRSLELSQMLEFAEQNKLLSKKEYDYWSDRLFHLHRRFILAMIPLVAELR